MKLLEAVSNILFTKNGLKQVQVGNYKIIQWDIVHVSVAGNPPLTFEECLKSLRKTTIGNPSLCTTSMVKLSLQTGDCYSGIHSQERSKLAVLQKKLKDLE